MRYTLCTTSADNLVYAREVIRSIARKHGLLATFVPKYVYSIHNSDVCVDIEYRNNYFMFFFSFRYSLDDIGSGSHVHLSLSRNGENVFMAQGESTEYGMSKIGEEFMAGVLHHLPSILAFTAPIPNRLKIQLLLTLIVYII